MEPIPKFASAFADIKIKQVACGYNHSALVTQDGLLYLCGSDQSLEPVQVTSSLQNEHIVRVACGRAFTAALSVDGKVFTMGKGSSTCLGHGSRWPESQPRLIEALANERVTR